MDTVLDKVNKPEDLKNLTIKEKISDRPGIWC